VGKRKGNQRDTVFTVFTDADFKAQFYDRRGEFDPALRRRVEREAKARGSATPGKPGSEPSALGFRTR
jgi:hypothetical protein